MRAPPHSAGAALTAHREWVGKRTLTASVGGFRPPTGSLLLRPSDGAAWATLAVATRAAAAIAPTAAEAAATAAAAAKLMRTALELAAPSTDGWTAHARGLLAEALVAASVSTADGAGQSGLQEAYAIAGALLQDPATPPTLGALANAVAARVLEAYGDAGQAAEAYQRAVALDPACAFAWERMARLYAASGEAAAAQQCLEAAAAPVHGARLRHAALPALRRSQQAAAAGDAERMLAAARDAVNAYGGGGGGGGGDDGAAASAGSSTDLADLVARLWLGLGLAARAGGLAGAGASADAKALQRALRSLQAVLARDPAWPAAKWAVDAVDGARAAAH